MNFFDKILIWVGSLYIRFVGVTSKITFKNSTEYELLEKNKKPVIYALWHGRQIILIWSHRKRNIHLLISRSKDGGYAAGVVHKFGFKTVRGSSSRDAVKALVGMIRKGREGFPLAFTPDGPRGPLHDVQPGIILASQKTGLPIIPLAGSAKRKYVVRSWDEFHIPYPFNKVAICNGRPIYVSADDDIEKKCFELKKAIDDVATIADSLV